MALIKQSMSRFVTQQAKELYLISFSCFKTSLKFTWLPTTAMNLYFMAFYLFIAMIQYYYPLNSVRKLHIQLCYLKCFQVIMATNRADTLDPALLRPGRLDRKIEFPLPDRRQKRLIFSTITGKMNLSDEVDLEDYVARPDKISGADINAICQEVNTCSLNFSSDSVFICFQN